MAYAFARRISCARRELTPTLHHAVKRLVDLAFRISAQNVHLTLPGSRSFLHVHDRYKSANRVTPRQIDVVAQIGHAGQCAALGQSLEHVIWRAKWTDPLVR